MKRLRFAVFGTGFWAQYQLAGWQELDGAACVALYNRTRSKAEALAARFGIERVYDDPEKLLREERPDFIDVITGVEANPFFVRMAADHGIPVICQKPMAPDLASAERMVRTCRAAGVPLMVHENWRFQRPIAEVGRLLRSRTLGRPFRSRILYANSYPVFENQPYLKELEQFILTDMGSHILDSSRFLFGEAESVFCQTTQVTPGIRGEDVATVMLRMGDGVTVTCALSYASRVEHDRYNETYITVECERGTIDLGPDYWISVTTRDGTLARRFAPTHYPWATPEFEIVHASIVPCNAHLLESLQCGTPADTSGADNLETMRLIFAAYESASTGQVVALS